MYFKLELNDKSWLKITPRFFTEAVAKVFCNPMMSGTELLKYLGNNLVLSEFNRRKLWVIQDLMSSRQDLSHCSRLSSIGLSDKYNSVLA